MKIVRTISIDLELWEKHRAMGTNISALCNDALRAGAEGIMQLRKKHREEGQQKIAVMRKVEDSIKRAKNLNAELAKALKMRAAGDVGPYLTMLCKKYGLERVDLVRRMERL